ncbi:programmed cell death protein 4 [Palaemon carinicauda]|uniref:programmed cell death protein 4 n=1 Tax=Palaemon carinicauda TaxID=392227 RepID=UPI0035B5E403
MRAHLVLVTAVELAMDHKPSHREMTSVLLADLYGHLLYETDYAKGYDTLIKNLSDLVLDTPDAPTILGNFIARSIADDCIPPKFLQSYKGKVYEAVVMVIENMDERTANMMCDLLESLHRAIIITPTQMRAGFMRVYEDMPQICVDVPPAYTILEKFVMKCQAAKVIGDDIVKKLPVRGRKRFVSEGDGGRVKDDAYF